MDCLWLSMLPLLTDNVQAQVFHTLQFNSYSVQISRLEREFCFMRHTDNYLLVHEIHDAQELLSGPEHHHFLASQEILEDLLGQVGLVDQEALGKGHETGSDHSVVASHSEVL